MKPAELPRNILDRTAVVYVRQSSMTQVNGNLESQRRQYELVRDARAYGFRAVEVIDDDLGTTARGVAVRPGFQKLVGLVCAGTVGAVFSVEASRLARNGRDWHHLIELCGLVGARVIDLEGVYDPSNPNDRLLLGLKGTMSEFELNVMRRRLTDALEAKARRGELRLCPPIGYVWSTDARRFEMEADHRVQEAIRFVFTRFDELGSANRVVHAMLREGRTFPSRRTERVVRSWPGVQPGSASSPTFYAIHSMLECTPTENLILGRRLSTDGRAGHMGIGGRCRNGPC